MAPTIAATKPAIVYSAASTAGSWPNSRSTPEVSGLMLASLASRKSSPKEPHQRTGNRRTGHCDPVDPTGAEHGRDLGSGDSTSVLV